MLKYFIQFVTMYDVFITFAGSLLPLKERNCYRKRRNYLPAIYTPSIPQIRKERML